MKRRIYFVIIMLLSFINLNNIYAQTTKKYFKNGWYFFVPAFNNPSKMNCAYYENGIETIRYSKFICAHMGWGTAPANSLSAFMRAVDEGYNCVETDIRFTSDNIPVLIHDATLERYGRKITNPVTDISDEEKSELASTKISDLTLQTLKENYVFGISNPDNGMIEGYTDNKITTLEEAFAYASDNKLTFNLELKEGTRSQIKVIVDLSKKYNLNGSVFYLSAKPDLLEYVKDESDSEYLMLIANGQTTDELVEIYYRLKTDNNMVYVLSITQNDFANIGFEMPTVDLPKSLENTGDTYVSSKFLLPVLDSFVSFKVNDYIKNDDKKVISRIIAGTTKDTLNIDTTGIITIKSNDNIEIVDNTNLATGNRLLAHFENDKYYYDLDYTISILGDVDGNSEVDMIDVKKISKHIVDNIITGDEYLLSADYNNDTKIKMNDVIKMLKDMQ